MPSQDVICAVLAYLTNHRWGTPQPKDSIINRCGVRTDLKGEAKDAVEYLRQKPFIENHGTRGITINTSEQHALAEYLHHQCGWTPEKIDFQLKHYEGIDDHVWS